MTIALSNIVEMSMNKIIILLIICVGVDDWTAEKVIIASNVTFERRVHFWWDGEVATGHNSTGPNGHIIFARIGS